MNGKKAKALRLAARMSFVESDDRDVVIDNKSNRSLGVRAKYKRMKKIVK